MGVVLGLLGLLAASGTANAWELRVADYTQGAGIGRFLQQTWSGIQAIWSKANFDGEPDYGQTSIASPAPGISSDPENHAEHSVGIDPNG